MQSNPVRESHLTRNLGIVLMVVFLAGTGLAVIYVGGALGGIVGTSSTTIQGSGTTPSSSLSSNSSRTSDTSPASSTSGDTTFTTIPPASSSTPSQTSTKGVLLLNYSGSGGGQSQPFKATTTTVNIKLHIAIAGVSGQKLSPNATVAWFIYPVGAQTTPVASGAESAPGDFEQQGLGLVPGQSYYLSVISANADWDLLVYSNG